MLDRVPKSKRPNYFMTDEEAAILWQHSKRWGTKWQAMMALALFRGLRIGEICAMNLYDFKDDNFRKFEIIFSKSHIHDEIPLTAEVSEVLKNYTEKNVHMFKDGYLFPGRKDKHLSVVAACAMFSKLRSHIKKEHASFGDRMPIIDPETGQQRRTKQGHLVWRYRITWHSCRRWFETRFWEEHKDVYALRDVMRYRDTKSIQPYIDSYRLWKEETERLQKAYQKHIKEFNFRSQGQTTLTGGYL